MPGRVVLLPSVTSCISQTAVLEMSSRYELGNGNEVSTAIQIAFIIAGCTHMTYYKTLKHALGIDAVHWHDFQSTIVSCGKKDG